MYLHEKWFKEHVYIPDYNKFVSTLFQNKLKYIVDRSFYPAKSYLISAAWIIVNRKERVVKGEFVSSVYES